MKAPAKHPFRGLVTLTPRRSADGSNDLLELQSRYSRLEKTHQTACHALASAAHELKTPTTIMTGYTDLLLTGKFGALTERQQGILLEMQSAGVRMRRLIEDFLQFGAAQSGQFTLQLAFSDLADSLQQVYRQWLPRLEEKGIALYLLDGPPLPRFYFDPFRIQQVLSNLLDNACKWTPQGGSVWIGVEPYQWERLADRDHHPNAVRVSVSDTGRGIAAEFQQEIFEDFFRADSASSEVEGFGLGLAIARRIVQAHGGKIWVESESQAGSRFCFLLPLQTNAVK